MWKYFTNSFSIFKTASNLYNADRVILLNLSEGIFDFSAVQGVPRIYGPLYKPVPRIYGPLYKPISFPLEFQRRTIHMKLSLGAISAINRMVFKLSLPKYTFSVVDPQCYQQNLFNGDPSLSLTYFMFRSA